VILDVVYNHTAEGGPKGPTISFKGLDPATYYLINSKGHWLNYTGCGNCINANHPIVIEWMLASLRYFAIEFQIDGFRFDLASALYRGENGKPIENPPIIDAITNDPLLGNLLLIAEPWDAGGLYHVGSFYDRSSRWSEWNGKYRDTIRCFIKGDSEEKGEFSTRLSGSEDLYWNDETPAKGVNFITTHDGFTLNDLVSYNDKHNEDNGEKNRDGANYNASWNCGAEGETGDQEITALRLRQMKNYLLALMVSKGNVMLFMGDEYRHNKGGNNNTWCHDGRINWFQWDTLDHEQDFYRFYKGLIHIRRDNPLITRNQFLSPGDVVWHGFEPNMPNWSDENGFIAYTLIDHEGINDIYIAFNADHNEAKITIPGSRGQWYQLVNTALHPPDDYSEEGVLITDEVITLSPYSSLLLITR
jgi:isoamylase/glycogen operon protein